MLTLLRHRTFGPLFAAQVVALLGTGLLTVALGLLAYQLAPGSASAVVGTALTIKIVAYVTLSPVIATLAQRVPRRVLLVGADVVRAGVAVVLPWVDHVWQVYVLVLVLQVASAAFTPAFQAVIPAILPAEDDYTRALSWSRLAYDLEALVSPVIAAVLLGVMSFHGLFLGTAAGFVASGLIVASVRLPAVVAAPVDDGALVSRLTRGVRRFAGRGELRALLCLELAVATGTAMVLVQTVVVARTVIGVGESAAALAFGAFGAGSVVVALAVPHLLRRWPERRLMLAGPWIAAAALAASVPLLISPTAAAWPALLALWAVLGAADALVLTPSARLLRRHSDEHDRPEIFAAHFSLSHACFLVTYPLAGWVGTLAGPATAALLLAGLAAVAAAVGVRAWPAPSARAGREVRVGATHSSP